MAVSEDTEITLGTGKMLLLFFGLVALCAVFFGMGYSLGKNSARPSGDPLAANGVSSVRPTAVKANEPRPPSDLTFYKAVEQKDPNTDTGFFKAGGCARKPRSPGCSRRQRCPSGSHRGDSGQSNYFVQVAAVSKQEDAAALVDALKKKQYAAFAANTPGDKLFHVQVGPFADIKVAENARSQLVKDGYNPILKK